MIDLVRTLGDRSLARLANLGRASIMWATALWGLPRLHELPLVIKQVYNVGVLSLVIIVLSAFSIDSEVWGVAICLRVSSASEVTAAG